MLSEEKRKRLLDSGYSIGSAIDFVNDVLTQPGDSLLTEQDLIDFQNEKDLLDIMDKQKT